MALFIFLSYLATGLLAALAIVRLGAGTQVLSLQRRARLRLAPWPSSCAGRRRTRPELGRPAAVRPGLAVTGLAGARSLARCRVSHRRSPRPGWRPVLRAAALLSLAAVAVDASPCTRLLPSPPPRHRCCTALGALTRLAVRVDPAGMILGTSTSSSRGSASSLCGGSSASPSPALPPVPCLVGWSGLCLVDSPGSSLSIPLFLHDGVLVLQACSFRPARAPGARLLQLKTSRSVHQSADRIPTSSSSSPWVGEALSVYLSLERSVPI